MRTHSRLGHGGARVGAGRPPSPHLIAVAAVRAIAEVTQATSVTDYGACGSLIDGMIAALGDEQDETTMRAIDWLESVRDGLRRTARRARAAGRLDGLVVKNESGRFEIAPEARRPQKPCECAKRPGPHALADCTTQLIAKTIEPWKHQHCAIDGCNHMGVAEAIDPWPIDDLLWGCPEPRGWHCDQHRLTSKRCIGVLRHRCTADVRTYVVSQIVRCPACRFKADAVAAAHRGDAVVVAPPPGGE
jgi:hypothetical protein